MSMGFINQLITGKHHPVWIFGCNVINTGCHKPKACGGNTKPLTIMVNGKEWPTLRCHQTWRVAGKNVINQWRFSLLGKSSVDFPIAVFDYIMSVVHQPEILVIMGVNSFCQLKKLKQLSNFGMPQSKAAFQWHRDMRLLNIHPNQRYPER